MGSNLNHSYVFINDNIGAWLGKSLSTFPPADWEHVETLDLDHFPAFCVCSTAANGKVPFSKSSFTHIHLWLFPMAKDWDLALLPLPPVFRLSVRKWSYCWCLDSLTSIESLISGPFWPLIPVLMVLKLTWLSSQPSHYSGNILISCLWIFAFLTFLATGNKPPKTIYSTSPQYVFCRS